MKIFLLQLEIRSGLECLVTGFIPRVPTLKKRDTQILLQGDIYMHEECNINHYKMPGKYYIFYDCQKIRIINHIKLVERRQKNFFWFVRALTYSFAVFVLFLWNLFLPLVQYAPSLFPTAGFSFFPNGIPTHFPRFLSAFQWLTPGRQMVQMARYIFAGLMKKTVRNLTTLAWCLVAELAAREEWQWLEIILIKMIWSLLYCKCYFYSSSFLYLLIPGLLPWKHIMSKLDTTAS